METSEAVLWEVYCGYGALLGLQYTHQHGLVHRDIKPSNPRLTSSGYKKCEENPGPVVLALARVP